MKTKLYGIDWGYLENKLWTWDGKIFKDKMIIDNIKKMVIDISYCDCFDCDNFILKSSGASLSPLK